MSIPIWQEQFQRALQQQDFYRVYVYAQQLAHQEPKQSGWLKAMGQALYHLGFNQSGRELLQTYANQVPQDLAILPYLAQPLPGHEPLPHQPPQVSGVLMVTRNTPWNQTMINSVIHQTPELQELWVVAEASTPLRPWLEVLRHQAPMPFKLILVQEPNHPASLNQAISLCQGNYIALLKDPAALPMGWLAHLLQALTMGPCHMVGWEAAPVSTDQALRHEIVASTAAIFEEYAQQQGVRLPVRPQHQRTLSLGGWLMTAKTWQQVGGWPSHLPLDAAGATEWCQRAAIAGIQVGTVPAIIALDLAQVEPEQTYQAQVWAASQSLTPKHWNPQTPCLITIP